MDKTQAVDPPPKALRQLPPRLLKAWRSWLDSLSESVDAAMAAAHMYAEMEPQAREAWLTTLAADAATLDVPRAALFGPLLAVEDDAKRRRAIISASGDELSDAGSLGRAMLGAGEGGVRVAMLTFPRYLNFVRVITCRWVIGKGFDWVEQDPLVHAKSLPKTGTQLGDVAIYPTATDPVIDALAHAVLAQRRAGKPFPPILQESADIFTARLSGATRAP